jgi:sigma-B regulation protein RsbU (phosphoserine phosphatase)
MLNAHKNRGITSKLIFLIVSGCSIIFVIILSFNYDYTKKILLQNAQDIAKNKAYAQVNKIEIVLKSIERVPSNSIFLIDSFSFNKADMLKLIKMIVERNDEIYGSTIAYQPYAYAKDKKYFSPYYYKQDNKLKFKYLGGSNYNYFDMDWFKSPKYLNKPTWSEPYYDKGGGNILMATYSVPFYKNDSAGKVFLGVMTSDVSLTWLEEILSSIKIFKTGFGFLISKKGTIITYPNKELIMRSTIFTIADATNNKMLHDIGNDMISGKSGIVFLDDFNGKKDCWLYYAPLSSQGWSLCVVFPNNELLAYLDRLQKIIFFIGVMGIIILATIIALITASIIRPLKGLTSATMGIADGNLNIDIPSARLNDEVGKLTNALIYMRDSLKAMKHIQHLNAELEKRNNFIREVFGRYLSDDIVTTIISTPKGLELGGKKQRLTIMMTDLRGFTSMSERLTPEAVVSMLNNYLGVMTEIIIKFQGTIDEFIGDAILVIFGAPVWTEDHAKKAAACAISMQIAMKEINQWNRAKGFPDIEMGIGINTGEVVVGNIGSVKRSKYGIVGSQVNLTSRIESCAIGGQILVSEETVKDCGSILKIKNVTEARFKGVNHPIKISDIIGIEGEYNLNLTKLSDPLRKLKTEQQIYYSVIDGKRTDENQNNAVILELSNHQAIILASSKVRDFTNLKLSIIGSIGEIIFDEIYCKVISSLEYPMIKIYFTSMPNEADIYLRNLL